MVNRNRKQSFGRLENTREERKTLEKRALLTFSFKDIDETQPKHNPQSLQIWQEDGLLQTLLIKLKELSKLTRHEAESQKLIKIYGDFPQPENTQYSYPKHIEENVAWGVISSIGGQKSRIAGYLIENTFYIVFLDKEHQFWLSKKKNT